MDQNHHQVLEVVLDSLQGLDNLDHFHNKVYKALAQKGLVKELELD